ncbi:MAG: 8-amino-7-oxononanoate synthase [Acidimicrobiia bacterium]|nr:8-amino-7-oxononanoate synthase [Acidimicrobiia bacterium]
MTATPWSQWVADQCARIASAGQWRRTRDLDAAGPAGSLIDDAGSRQVISFASNDYLGLTQHPAVIAAAHGALDRWGAGSGAARLIVGSRPVHGQLEEELAAWKRTERALLFPTGFAANLGVLSTLATSGVRVCSDELNHASIIDGCRLGRGDVHVYPHRDVDAVDKLLSGAERSIVVTDTVFSMDGDSAPVDELIEVCTRHGALLVLDEAHAVLGPNVEVPDDADVLRVGTLSKMLGALGGFVAGPQPFIDLLVNRARPFIFTTASTPADTAAALAAVRVLRSPEGEALIATLRRHVDRIAPGHNSPIIPVVLGDEGQAMAASAALLERGLLVPAIRPPTVAPGTSRLRIALSAAHTDAQIALLADALRETVGAAA